jgi:conjugative relaxase-like TrwC/TraI family protein
MDGCGLNARPLPRQSTGSVLRMVMTIAKITAGDGYTYLTNHVARGDAEPGGARDATAYYTVQGNPPGTWTGRGAPLLGLAGREVTEEQMLALFGLGQHPDGEAISTAYIREHVRAKMTERQLLQLRDRAIAAGQLGRPFPAYEALDPFDARVAARLEVIRQETGREPAAAEENRVRAQEARRQRAAVAGFDLVFSPVKSAAVLWAVDPRPWVRDAVRDAHQAAMREAMELLEEHAAFTRTGHGGIAQVATNGLTAAAFEHWDSRAGDPNLHTHVAVSSKVQGTDGKWRALDARALYRITVAVSEAYNTGFEAHLTARLGVTFTARPGTKGREPVREVSGVPASVVGFFSRRRAAIEARYAELVREYRAGHGHDPAPGVTYDLARRANLDTRQGKKPPRSLADKRAAWQEELRAAFGDGAVQQLMNVVPVRAEDQPAAVMPTAEALDELAERVVASVSASRSTWTVWNLRAEAERQIRATVPGVRPGQHRQLADTVTSLAASPGRSISVEAPSLLDEPAGLRRADGSSVFTQHGAARYTSQAVLDAETRLVNATRTPTACGLAGPAAAASLDGFEARSGTSLDPGQRELVTAFACDSRLLLAGIGPAGAGKTTAMRALAHVLRDGGQRLIPLATSAASADVLGRELGVRAENLHKFIHEHTAGPFAARLRAGASVPEQARMFRLHPGDVILVDEAGMAGTFLLDKLVSLAATRGAVVRLLGDDRQLPAVEGGGALRLVAAEPGTPQLTRLYRFRDPAEGAATLRLRMGDAAAVDWYHAAGRVRAGSREAMAAAAYDGWKSDMLAGKVTLMAAADTSAVTGLSGQARADRVIAGQVEPDGVRLRDGNLAGQGDWVVTRDNQRRLCLFGGRDWVKNGDSWQVTQRHPDGSLRVRHLGHGGHATLPADYVRDHVQLLYATSAHRAQGTTVDTAHPLVTTGMSREALYVLATRAREKTVLYVATHDQPFDDDARVDKVRRDPRQYAGREILLNVLAIESAPLPATETIVTAQEEAASLATLVPHYLHAAHEDADARYRLAATAALGPDDGHSVTADPAWGSVVRRLFDAEGGGWDPARLLTTVAARRELGTADSIAEVITWRIDAFLSDNPPPAQEDAPAPTSAAEAGNAAVPRPYEHTAAARERLTTLAVTTLGGQLAARAQHETAWPALIAALRRAENTGYSPADALTRTATSRELRTARSISETLAWRINHHLATQDPITDTGAGRQDGIARSSAVPLLPWVPAPRNVTADSSTSAPMAAYLSDAAALITSRAKALADDAVRLRQPWATALGPRPDEPSRAAEWQRNVQVVAAYRDQYKVTTDDPRQVLGPYAEPGRAGHRAYWHAAGSLLAARQLAGLEPSSPGPASALATAQLTADTYRSLPDDERAVISAMIAASNSTQPSIPAAPDEHDAAQPAYAPQLVSALTSRGHLNSAAGHQSAQQAGGQADLAEAVQARRAQRGHVNASRPESQAAGPRAQALRPVYPRVPVPGTGPAPRLLAVTVLASPGARCRS